MEFFKQDFIKGLIARKNPALNGSLASLRFDSIRFPSPGVVRWEGGLNLKRRRRRSAPALINARTWMRSCSVRANGDK